MKADKITKAKVQLILGHPFFATLALKMQYQEDCAIPTANIDGKTIRYNPQFIENLSMDETKGVLAHEVSHVALLHHTRRQGRDPRKWNEACDYAINPILLDSGFVLPKGHLFNQAFVGKSAEEIYNLLPPSQDGDKGGDDTGGCGSVSDAPAQTQSELQEIEAEAKQMVAQAAMIAKKQGKLPAQFEELIEELLQPSVSWREVLAAFLTEIAKNDYTWTKPSKRFLSQGLYLPSLESKETGEFILVVDTSASVDNEQLKQFGGEMQAILSDFQKGFTILYVDTKVAHVQEVEPDEDLKLNAKGRGGTDFRPPFRWVEENGVEPAALIYLTDMECNSFPDEPDYPVLWAKYGDRGVDPPFGELIKIQPSS